MSQVSCHRESLNRKMTVSQLGIFVERVCLIHPWTNRVFEIISGSFRHIPTPAPSVSLNSHLSAVIPLHYSPLLHSAPSWSPTNQQSDEQFACSSLNSSLKIRLEWAVYFCRSARSRDQERTGVILRTSSHPARLSGASAKWAGETSNDATTTARRDVCFWRDAHFSCVHGRAGQSNCGKGSCEWIVFALDQQWALCTCHLATM
jgi:hypothetical protein